MRDIVSNITSDEIPEHIKPILHQCMSIALSTIENSIVRRHNPHSMSASVVLTLFSTFHDDPEKFAALRHYCLSLVQSAKSAEQFKDLAANPVDPDATETKHDLD